MKTPFTTEQFLKVFEEYNLSVFPFQLIILILGLFAVSAIWSGKPVFSKVIGAYMAFIWLWAGIVYHISFFASLNSPAYFFGALFIIEGLLLLNESFMPGGLRFHYKNSAKEITGLFLIIFGLVLYPLLSWFMKGSPSLIISVGLPCPTVIITFGFLALVSGRVRWFLYIIPVLWSLVGISAALNFGIYQDFMMLAGGIAVIVLNSLRKGKEAIPVPMTELHDKLNTK